MLVSCGPVKNYDQPGEPYSEGHYAAESPVPGEAIKVVTWNLSFAEELESAIEALTNVSELQEADILLFQEMDAEGVDLIAHTLRYNYIFYPASIHRRHNKDFGNAVLSTWPIEESEKFLLPGSGSSYKHTRNAVLAKIRIEGHTITAISTHFETFWIFQRKKSTQAEFLANQINKDEELVYIGGDFNSLTNGSVKFLEERFNQIGLERLSKNSGHTFEYSGVKLTLDHIFASRVEDFEAGVWRGSDASDHFPLWAKITPDEIQ